MIDPKEETVRHVLNSCVNREVAADTGKDPAQSLQEWLHGAPGRVSHFREGFMAVMNDPTQTLVKKAWIYIGEDLDEEEARQRFAEIWKMATGEIWSED